MPLKNTKESLNPPPIYLKAFQVSLKGFIFLSLFFAKKYRYRPTNWIIMKKIELEIVALSHSITQSHSYAVVLGEVNGLRRLPIVIGGFEAQAIAVALERINPTRPLTHDLMKNFMLAFNVELHEIVINDVQGGVFYSKLVCSSANDTVEIDSRTSDALALAVRFGCSIFTYENILDQAGVMMNDDAKKDALPSSASVSSETIGGSTGSDLKSMSLTELNTLLTEVLEQEDYIRAISIRDEIKSREK
jgi:bifunctional DNase/RNase